MDTHVTDLTVGTAHRLRHRPNEPHRAGFSRNDSLLLFISGCVYIVRR